MLKWIHSNQKSLGVVLIASTATLVMTGFGISMGRDTKQHAAIKVNEREISFPEFEHEKKIMRRSMEEQYKRMFGKDYYKIVGQLNLDAGLSPRMVDNLIADSLIEEQARKVKMIAGDEELKNTIKFDLFPNGFDADAYREILREYSLDGSSADFENRLRSQLLKQQYTRMLEDASLVSTREARAMLKLDETAYSANYVEIDPASYVKDVKDPADADLESYYTEHASEYEIGARVTYNYVVFDPQKLESSIELNPEDVELYYSENESKFKEPPAYRLQQIKILYSKDNDPKAMLAVKTRAEEAHAKAIAGEPFETLVTLYSDDLATKTRAGDMGWVKRGENAGPFDQNVFKLKTPGIAELIETDYGFHIVKVGEIRPERVKDLNEVRAQIESELKKAEAPAISSAKAAEAEDLLRKGKSTLADIATANKLEVKSTSGALEEHQDPSPDLAGLSAQALQFAGGKFGVADLKDNAVLVEVSKAEEPRIPALAEVKDKVLVKIRERESKRLAEEAAQKVVDSLKENKAADLATVAKTMNLKVEDKTDMKRSGGTSGIFAIPQIKDALFSVFKENATPTQYYSNAGKFYVFQVKSIVAPKPEDIEKKLSTYKKQASQKSADLLFTSIVNRLKSKATIDVDPTLTARSDDAAS